MLTVQHLVQNYANYKHVNTQTSVQLKWEIYMAIIYIYSMEKSLVKKTPWMYCEQLI